VSQDTACSIHCFKLLCVDLVGRDVGMEQESLQALGGIPREPGMQQPQALAGDMGGHRVTIGLRGSGTSAFHALSIVEDIQQIADRCLSGIALSSGEKARLSHDIQDLGSVLTSENLAKMAPEQRSKLLRALETADTALYAIHCFDEHYLPPENNSLEKAIQSLRSFKAQEMEQAPAKGTRPLSDETRKAINALQDPTKKLHLAEGRYEAQDRKTGFFDVHFGSPGSSPEARDAVGRLLTDLERADPAQMRDAIQILGKNEWLHAVLHHNVALEARFQQLVQPMVQAKRQECDDAMAATQHKSELSSVAEQLHGLGPSSTADTMREVGMGFQRCARTLAGSAEFKALKLEYELFQAIAMTLDPKTPGLAEALGRARVAVAQLPLLPDVDPHGQQLAPVDSSSVTQAGLTGEDGSFRSSVRAQQPVPESVALGRVMVTYDEEEASHVLGNKRGCVDSSPDKPIGMITKFNPEFGAMNTATERSVADSSSAVLAEVTVFALPCPDTNEEKIAQLRASIATLSSTLHSTDDQARKDEISLQLAAKKRELETLCPQPEDLLEGAGRRVDLVTADGAPAQMRVLALDVPTIDLETRGTKKDRLMFSPGMVAMSLESEAIDGTYEVPRRLSDDEKKDPVKLQAYERAMKKYDIGRYTLGGKIPSLSEAQKTKKVLTVEQANAKIADLINTATTKEQIDGALQGMMIQTQDGEIISGEMFFRKTVEAQKRSYLLMRQAAQGSDLIMLRDKPAAFATGLARIGGVIGDGTTHTRMEILADKYLLLSGNSVTPPLACIAFNDHFGAQEMALMKKVWEPQVKVLRPEDLVQDDGYVAAGSPDKMHRTGRLKSREQIGLPVTPGGSDRPLTLVINPKSDSSVAYFKSEKQSSKAGQVGHQWNWHFTGLDPSFWRSFGHKLVPVRG
jgi:hypothetical protein